MMRSICTNCSPMIVGNQSPPLAIKEENHTAIRMDRNHALPGRIQRPGTVLQHPPLGDAAAAAEGARAGSLAAGARRSRPPAAPAQQRRATAAHGAGRRPPPPAASSSIHRSRQAAGGQASGRREVLPPRAARGGLQRCTRRPDGRTGRWGDGRRAAGRRAQRPEHEATSCGRRRRAGCGRVARLAWAASQAATKPHANPRLHWAEA